MKELSTLSTTVVMEHFLRNTPGKIVAAEQESTLMNKEGSLA
jgi:hypothetical protein